MEFIDREEELEIIKQCEKLSERKIYSLVISGLRRVGKTRLILEALKDSLYFFVDENKSMHEILLEIETELKEKEIVEEYVKIDSFKTFLNILIEKYKGVIVFDEFQNFYKIDKSVFGELQRFFDLHENKKDIFFVFSGSLLGLIKKILSKKAPLYGRIKREIKLKPIKLEDIYLMCQKLKIKDFKEILKLYFVFGGFPRYYVAIEDEALEGASFDKILSRFFLEPNAIFEEEVEKIITMEFGRRKKTYYSILAAIANGKNTLTGIASELSLKSTSITRQLNELLNFFELVKKESQVIGKKSLYIVKHPLIEFWFRFFYKNISAYKKRDPIFLKYLKENINSFFGRKFEDVCLKLIEKYELIPIKFTKIGKQWGKIKGKPKGENTYEIDILAINEQSKELLAAECKWQSRVNAERLAKELVEKLNYVDWHKGKRKEDLAIFAKSFSKRIKSFNGRKVYCFDLRDLEKVIKANSDQKI